MHDNSKLLFGKYGVEHFKTGQKVFEISPDCYENGASTYRKQINDKVEGVEYFWGDIINWGLHDPKCVKFKSEYEIEAESNLFDVVFCGQVLEHVRKPWIWIKEVARVTKVGGKIILINPITWGYHEAPVDCWRVYPEGIKALFEEANVKMEFSKFESLDGLIVDTFSVGTKMG